MSDFTKTKHSQTQSVSGARAGLSSVNGRQIFVDGRRLHKFGPKIGDIARRRYVLCQCANYPKTNGFIPLLSVQSFYDRQQQCHSGNDKGLKAKHCLTVHSPSTQRTLILQWMNCGFVSFETFFSFHSFFTVLQNTDLISKYASNVKALNGVKQGLSALKMGLSGHKSKKMSAKPMVSAPCSVQPFVSLITMIGAQNSHGLRLWNV